MRKVGAQQRLQRFDQLHADIRWVGDAHIKSAFRFENFGEINPEVEVDLVAEALLRCRKTFAELAVNLPFQLSLTVVIGFLKETSLQLFDLVQALPGGLLAL